MLGRCRSTGRVIGEFLIFFDKIRHLIMMMFEDAIVIDSINIIMRLHSSSYHSNVTFSSRGKKKPIQWMFFKTCFVVHKCNE